MELNIRDKKFNYILYDINKVIISNKSMVINPPHPGIILSDKIKLFVGGDFVGKNFFGIIKELEFYYLENTPNDYFKRKCIKCESNQYYDGVSKTCINCTSPCSKCIGPGLINCLNCILNYYLIRNSLDVYYGACSLVCENNKFISIEIENNFSNIEIEENLIISSYKSILLTDNIFSSYNLPKIWK